MVPGNCIESIQSVLCCTLKPYIKENKQKHTTMKESLQCIRQKTKETEIQLCVSDRRE